MSKERLEEIKIMVKLEKQGKESGISTSDFDYLISRIDELEEKVLNKNIIIRHSSEEKEEIQQEKSKWKDTAQSYYVTNQELRERNKQYKQALEFYADKENYKPFDGIFLSSYQNKVDEDGGEVARKALEGEK